MLNKWEPQHDHVIITYIQACVISRYDIKGLFFP